MTFHKTDRVEYVRSGRKLREENLQTLTKYFESIYDTQVIETTYSQSQHEKVQSDARKQACHELQERYTRKMHYFSNKRRSGRSHAQRNNDYYGRREIRAGRERHYDRRNDGSGYKKSPQVYRKNPQDYSSKRNSQERGSRKSLQEYKKRFIKPCPLHGLQATIPTKNVAKFHVIKLNRNRAQTATITNAPSIATIKTAAPTTTAT